MTEETTDQEIGRRILENRRALAYSQTDFSIELRKSGVNWSQGTISKVEAGDRPVRLAEAASLSRTLGISVDDLAGVAHEESSFSSGLKLGMKIVRQAVTETLDKVNGYSVP